MNRTFHKPYKPRFASRKDYSHHKTFGAAPAVPLPDNLYKLPDVIEDQGALPACTAAASVTCRSIMTGKRYDWLAQWNLELQHEGVSDAPDGFPLEVPAKVGKEMGFVPLGQPLPVDKTGGYFFKNSKNPGQDWFDTLRQTQFQLFQQTGKIVPMQFGVNWYREWDDAIGARIPTSQSYLLGGHDTTWAGWKTDGVPLGVNPNTWGNACGDKGIFYWSREATNKNIGPLGVFYWLDAVDMPPQVVRLGLFAAILQNFVALLRAFVIYVQKNPPDPIPAPVAPLTPVLPPTPPVSRISLLAEGIFEAEGNGTQAGMALNNRGDIKFTQYAKSLGAIGASPANFAVFRTMEEGDQACRQLCTDAAMGELKAYKPTDTLNQFCQTYAEPPILSVYVNRVLKHLPECTPETQIKELL